MNRKDIDRFDRGDDCCLTLVGASTPAGAQDAGPQNRSAEQRERSDGAGRHSLYISGTAQEGRWSVQRCVRLSLHAVRCSHRRCAGGHAADGGRDRRNGLFTAPLDFGNQFTGQARWLETAVKCAGDADFIPQSPRLTMTSSPYAIGLVPGAVVQGATNKPGDAVFWVKNR